MSSSSALAMGLVWVWAAAAHAVPLPLPLVEDGAAKAEGLAFDGRRGVVTWRVDELVLASRFSAEGGLISWEPLDKGGFVVAVADRGTTTDVAVAEDGFVVVTAGGNGVSVTRVAERGEVEVTSLASGPASHGRVACRGAVCVAAWVEVRAEAQVVHTARLGAGTYAVATAAPLAGRVFSGVALDASDGWRLAWSHDAGTFADRGQPGSARPSATFVQSLDADGRTVGEPTRVEGSVVALIGEAVVTVVGDATRVTPLDGVAWSLPGGALVCRVGDALRVAWQDGGVAYTQVVGLDGVALDTPTSLAGVVVDLACADGAIGLAQVGSGVALVRFGGEHPRESVPTAVAQVESLGLVGSPDGWLVYGLQRGPQGSRVFAIDVAADLTTHTTLLSDAGAGESDGAVAVDAAFDGGWRVGWRIGTAVWTSRHGPEGWSEPARALEVAGLTHFALGGELMLWTTASTTSVARFSDGVLGEPTTLPHLAGGTLRCGAGRCVLLRHSGEQFVGLVITPTDDALVVSPQRVIIGVRVESFDAAPRGEQTLVTYVRGGQLHEQRVSATGVLIGGEGFGPAGDAAVAPTDTGWLVAGARDGKIAGVAVADDGASGPLRTLVRTVAGASRPLLASGPGGVLLVHREGAFDVQRWVMHRALAPAPLGAPCDDAERCQSGFCVDGVCCADACFGGKADCFSCAGSSRPDGECGVLAEGARCSEVDTACDPADRCDASGACVAVVAPAGTPCGDQGIWCRVDDACDGLGVCIDGGLEGAGEVCGTPDACGEVGVCDVGGLCVREPCELCVRDCPIPPGCGNGVLDPGEECDAGANNAALGNHCRPWCALPMCGDGIVDQAEQCDLGTDNGQGECTTECRRVRGPVTKRESGCSGGSLGLFGGLLGLLCLLRRRGLAVIFLAGCGDTTRDVPRDCAIDNGGCAEHATCTTVPNPAGGEGVTCECDTGWVGDGLTCVARVGPECDTGYRPTATGCVDIDECLAGLDDCEQRCVNTDGGFECVCFPGYAPSDGRCVDIDECALGLDDCAMDCTNTVGGFDCLCAAGFRQGGEADPANAISGDGHDCVDIDECAGTPGCVYGCVNLYGSFTCTCAPGFALAADGVSCEDYDECQHERPCQGVCTNTVGGFSCGCEDGQRLEPTDHCTSQLQTFDAPGTFVVPDGVTALVIEAWGGQGGLSTFGGLGGYVYARVPVTRGDVLYVRVGRTGTNDGSTVGGGASGLAVDTNGRGGGGGGASDVRWGGEALADRIVVAGGGGGGGRGVGQTATSRSFGGAGGGLTGGNGSGQLGFHGTGGTPREGGSGASRPPLDSGGLGVGGASVSGALASGGGGGGGLYGGGAGESGFVGGGGGGGSSYVTPEAPYVVHEQGVRSGHGTVHIRW